MNDLKHVKKMLGSDQKYYGLVLETIYNLPMNKKYKLLDVGAGPEISFLKKLIPHNIEYKSLDISGNHDYLFDLDKLKEKGKLPIENNSFDIIVCLETLEHTIYPEKVMKELLRIGKEDSIFLLSMPNEYNFWARIQFLFNIQTHSRKAFETVINHYHIHCPRAKDVLNFFSKFVKIEKIYYCWYSRTSTKNKSFILLDRIINRLSKISPSLFSRNVTIVGKKKVLD